MLENRFGFLSALIFALGLAPTYAQDQILVLTNARVLDVESGTTREGFTVSIEGRRIVSIEPDGASPPPGAEVVDIRGMHLMPGLIDAHSHLSGFSPTKLALESGVTTLRTAGVNGYTDVVYRDLVKEGTIAGPDILATGIFVTPDIGDGILADHRLAKLIDGVHSDEELRYLVQVNHDRGADWIKTRTTERAGRPETDPLDLVYTEDQIRVIVEEGAKYGMPVMVHAHADEGVRAAILGGARSVEHATYATDATLRLMKERGTYLVPTLASITSFGAPGDYADPAIFLRGQHMAPRRKEMVQRAYAMGIPLVTGADTSYGPGATARISRGLEMLVELGVSPIDAIRAATSRAAEMLEIEEQTGVIRVGLEADLLVVERNPLEFIRDVQDPRLIVSNGQIVLRRGF